MDGAYLVQRVVNAFDTELLDGERQIRRDTEDRHHQVGDRDDQLRQLHRQQLASGW